MSDSSNAQLTQAQIDAMNAGWDEATRAIRSSRWNEDWEEIMKVTATWNAEWDAVFASLGELVHRAKGRDDGAT